MRKQIVFGLTSVQNGKYKKRTAAHPSGKTDSSSADLYKINLERLYLSPAPGKLNKKLRLL